jgi:hypothetical protein
MALSPDSRVWAYAKMHYLKWSFPGWGSQTDNIFQG